MLSANERITPRQFQILFILEAFGTGFVVMPRLVASYAGQDGWIVALLLVIPGLVFAALISGAARAFGNEPFAVYTKRLLSRPVAFLICLALWGKILLCAGLELRLFGGIVKEILLHDTPSLAVYIAVLAVAGYAAYKGIEARARLAEILIVVIAIPLAVMGLVALFNIDFTNLMPVFTTPTERLAFGVLSLGFIFTGLEFMFLAIPYLNKPREGLRAATGAMAFAGVLMAVIVAFTLAKFGFYNVRAMDWPVLKMMDALNISSTFVARQEALVLSFWMLSVFAFMAASLFYSAVLGRDFVKRGKHFGWVVACSIIIACLALIPLQRDQIYLLLNWIFLTFGLGFWVGLPIILTIVRKLRKKSLPAALLLVFLFSGCWDSVELENRAFVVAFGVDSTDRTDRTDDSRFQFSIAIASESEGGDEDEDEDSNSAFASDCRTLTEAMHNQNARSSRDMFLGQAKTVVFGKSVLKEQNLFDEAIRTIENTPGLDRTLTVLSTEDNVPEILGAHPDSESKPGYYVVNFSKLASKSGGHSFHKNFDQMMADLRAGGCTLLPIIKKEENDISVEGAIVIKDNQMSGELRGTELRGLLWAKNRACEGAILTTDDNISMTIRRHRASLHFDESNGGLRCIVHVRVKGDEYTETISESISEIISNEIKQTAQKLQQELNTDAGNFLLTLRKRNFPLYQKYAHEWETAFKEMEIVPVVRFI